MDWVWVRSRVSDSDFGFGSGLDREDESRDGHGLEDVHDTILERLMDDMEIQRNSIHKACELRLYHDAIASSQRDERCCDQLPYHDA